MFLQLLKVQIVNYQSRCVWAEEFVLEAIPKALSSNRDSQLDLQMPISIHLDHLHNVFIAAGTLTCAVIIVVITVRHSVLVPSVTHSDLVISRFSIMPLSFCTATQSKNPPNLNSLYQNISTYEQWLQALSRYMSYKFSYLSSPDFNYFTKLVHLYKLVTLWNSFPRISLNIQQIEKLWNCSYNLYWSISQWTNIFMRWAVFLKSPNFIM